MLSHILDEYIVHISFVTCTRLDKLQICESTDRQASECEAFSDIAVFSITVEHRSLVHITDSFTNWYANLGQWFRIVKVLLNNRLLVE